MRLLAEKVVIYHFFELQRRTLSGSHPRVSIAFVRLRALGLEPKTYGLKGRCAVAEKVLAGKSLARFRCKCKGIQESRWLAMPCDRKVVARW